MKSNRIVIFDTTLRDGEQCPGASMNLREKLEVARQLDRLVLHWGLVAVGDMATVEIDSLKPGVIHCSDDAQIVIDSVEPPWG